MLISCVVNNKHTKKSYNIIATRSTTLKQLHDHSQKVYYKCDGIYCEEIALIGNMSSRIIDIYPIVGTPSDLYLAMSSPLSLCTERLASVICNVYYFFNDRLDILNSVSDPKLVEHLNWKIKDQLYEVWLKTTTEYNKLYYACKLIADRKYNHIRKFKEHISPNIYEMLTDMLELPRNERIKLKHPFIMLAKIVIRLHKSKLV